MKKYLFLFTFLTISGFSALSPLHQSIREIDAILTNPELPERLPTGDKIKEITKIDDGYLVITNAHVLKVQFDYQKTSRIGPKKFLLKFLPATKI